MLRQATASLAHGVSQPSSQRTCLLRLTPPSFVINATRSVTRVPRRRVRCDPNTNPILDGNLSSVIIVERRSGDGDGRFEQSRQSHGILGWSVESLQDCSHYSVHRGPQIVAIDALVATDRTSVGRTSLLLSDDVVTVQRHGC